MWRESHEALGQRRSYWRTKENQVTKGRKGLWIRCGASESELRFWVEEEDEERAPIVVLVCFDSILLHEGKQIAPMRCCFIRD